MLVEQIDDTVLQPLRARPSLNFLDVLRTAVEATLCPVFGSMSNAELGGDHDSLAEGGKRFATKFLVGERAVDFRGVKQRDAALDGRTDQRDAVLLVDRRTVAEAQTHAAEADA